jgi:hypothetical protein
MCRKPEVRQACVHSCSGRMTGLTTLIRGEEGMLARGMEESGKVWTSRIKASRGRLLTVLVEVG